MSTKLPSIIITTNKHGDGFIEIRDIKSGNLVTESWEPSLWEILRTCLTSKVITIDDIKQFIDNVEGDDK